MAIINVTTDSFYAPARYSDASSAVAAASAALESGADLIDVGGVRAGQQGEWIDADTETARVKPILEALRETHPQAVLSLDTWRSTVASRCAGLVDLVNDTWAGYDPELVDVAAQLGAGYVVSHSGGLPPRTDPHHTHYDNVLTDVLDTLRKGAVRALEAGIPPERILVDPTLDFGKTTLHSLELVAQTSQIVALGFPVLMAISRKDFIGETLDLNADERLEGTLAATAVAAWLGATVFRAHDVRETRRVVDMVASLRGDRPPAKIERGM